MKTLHTQFGANLEILLFPSDEFGRQELPEDQIPDFCESKGLPVNAPGCHMMAKINTNGPGESPVFSLGKAAFPGNVTWNFGAVFLFDKEGNCVARKTTTSLSASDIAKLM